MNAPAECEVCGNSYDDPITVTQGERTGVFDSFECALHAMAPSCAHCGCRVIGHGVQIDRTVYCCAHCAHHDGGRQDVSDRA